MKNEEFKQPEKPTSGKIEQGASSTFTSAKVTASIRGSQSMLDSFKEARAKQAEVLKTKTHQDLVNAAYKAAEKLKISPWAILKEEWADFTKTRDAKYTGPLIDDLKHLDDAQKQALREALGL